LGQLILEFFTFDFGVESMPGSAEVSENVTEICSPRIVCFFPNDIEDVQNTRDIEMRGLLAFIGAREDDSPVTLVVRSFVPRRNDVINFRFVSREIDFLLRNEADPVLALP
jgi:hypothetical protein